MKRDNASMSGLTKIVNPINGKCLYIQELKGSHISHIFTHDSKSVTNKLDHDLKKLPNADHPFKLTEIPSEEPLINHSSTPTQQKPMINKPHLPSKLTTSTKSLNQILYYASIITLSIFLGLIIHIIF